MLQSLYRLRQRAQVDLGVVEQQCGSLDLIRLHQGLNQRVAAVGIDPGPA